MIPNDQTIRDDCRTLELDWPKLADRLVKIAERDRRGTTIADGYPRRTLNTDIPANDPESLTSVEAAAEANVFTRPERDHVHEAVAHALSALSQAALAVGSLIDNLRRAEELQVWQRPVGQTSTPCKVEGCDSPAVKRGYCDTDNRAALRWEEEHGEPIPPAKLEANAAERQIRKKRQPA